MTNPILLRPSVTLKLATSLDARIATVSGNSKWITGGESRALVHQMRAQHDCVLTGIGTILADDPELTARTDPRPEKQPVRVVLDTKASVPRDSRFLATADAGIICLIHGLDARSAASSDHTNIVRCYVDRVEGENNGVNLNEVMSLLQGRFAIKSIMVEAGARLAGAFLRARLVDKIVWFRAPIVIGGDGLSVFASLGVEELSQALALDCLDISKAGDDVVETYALKRLL